MPQKVLGRLAGHTDEVWYVLFSHDGKWLASASKDNTICIWDVKLACDAATELEDALRWRFKDHNQPVHTLAWSPDDSFLLLLDHGCAIRMWDMQNGENVRCFMKHTKGVMACVWSPFGRKFCSGASDKMVYEWDAESDDVISSFKLSKEIMGLALTSDGKRLICCLSDNTIQVCDTIQHESLYEVQESHYIISCELARNDKSLLVSTTPKANSSGEQEDVEIHLWDLEKRSLQKIFFGSRQCRFVVHACFGDQQQFVVSGSEDNIVYVWDRHTGDLLFKLKEHTDNVNAVHWSPVKKHLQASCSDDSLVLLWEADPVPKDSDSP